MMSVCGIKNEWWCNDEVNACGIKEGECDEMMK